MTGVTSFLGEDRRKTVHGARFKVHGQKTTNRQRLTINGHGWHGQTSLLAFGEFVRGAVRDAR
jgi:hypothetical protein